jgi:hypothetical protein
MKLGASQRRQAQRQVCVWGRGGSSGGGSRWSLGVCECVCVWGEGGVTPRSDVVHQEELKHTEAWDKNVQRPAVTKKRSNQIYHYK